MLLLFSPFLVSLHLPKRRFRLFGHDNLNIIGVEQNMSAFVWAILRPRFVFGIDAYFLHPKKRG